MDVTIFVEMQNLLFAQSIVPPLIRRSRLGKQIREQVMILS